MQNNADKPNFSALFQSLKFREKSPFLSPYSEDFLLSTGFEFNVVCSHRDRSWQKAKIMMQKIDQFLESLVHYDKENIHKGRPHREGGEEGRPPKGGCVNLEL